MEGSPLRKQLSVAALLFLLCAAALMAVSYPKNGNNFSLEQHRNLGSAISLAQQKLPVQSALTSESKMHTINVNSRGKVNGNTNMHTIGAINDVKDYDPVSVKAMAERLSPKEVKMDESKNMTLAGHQFLHLHHMKTGGTSVDKLINCAKSRLMDMGYNVPYYQIHECDPPKYKKCVDGTNQYCRNQIKRAAVLSYCAPLKDLEDPFGWTPEDGTVAVTVFRHPVARAWSMYRFATRGCYKCKTLKEIYEDIDNDSPYFSPNCKAQLLNHQTRNVLSAQGVEMDNEDLQVEEAIANMKRFFTMVGLTEDMKTTHEMVSRVFPWLAEEYEGSNKTCGLGKFNASPKNNRCMLDGSHWPLPDEPDEETARIILEHNQADMRLYEAAVEQFQLQKIALGL